MLYQIGFGIWNRHRQAVCLQLSRPFRIALLTLAMELWSEIAIRLRDRVRRGQIGGPFRRRLRPCSGRLGGDDRPLPDTFFLAKLAWSIELFLGFYLEKTIHMNSIHCNEIKSFANKHIANTPFRFSIGNLELRLQLSRLGMIPKIGWARGPKDRPLHSLVDYS